MSSSENLTIYLTLSLVLAVGRFFFFSAVVLLNCYLLKKSPELILFMSNFLLVVTLGFSPASKARSIGSSALFFMKPMLVLSVSLLFNWVIFSHYNLFFLYSDRYLEDLLVSSDPFLRTLILKFSLLYFPEAYVHSA